MNLFQHPDSVPPELLGGAVTIGNFDGVHLGHAKILRRVIELNESLPGGPLAFTFNPHPAEILRPSAVPPPLTWLERKAELIQKTGIAGVVAYPTDAELLALSAEDFFHQIIVEQLQATAVVEGPNFFFGRGRAGDVNTLKQLCHEHKIHCEIIDPTAAGGEIVSSSRIRELIQAGNVADADAMLTAPYRLRGVVSQGAQRGHKIGFPTANLKQIDTIMPALGVYAGRAIVSVNETYPAAIHIGPNPTFGEDAVKVEVHLIGYEGNLYNSWLQVEFLQRLRGIEKFDSVDQLTDQLASDVELTQQIANAND